jgi:hypothetical protein
MEEKMPDKKDNRKDLETLLANEYSAEERKSLRLFFKTASWNRIEDANVTTTNILTPGKSCESQKLLDVSGYASTGANGTARFRLTQFICFNPASFDYPMNVVAVPLTSKPVFLTVQRSLVMDPTNSFGIDVEFEVFTWDANGAAAPNITFDWRCRVPFFDLIL